MLGIKYATYYENRRKALEKAFVVNEEELCRESCMKYAALFLNDMIYDNIISLKDDLVKLGMFKFAVKKIYNDIRAEIKSYMARQKQNIKIDQVLFADLTINMEDIYKSYLNEIYSGIDKELQERKIKRDKRKILTRLIFMQIMCLSNKATVDNFNNRVMQLVGIKTHTLDFVYMEKIDYLIDKLQTEILGKDNGQDLSNSEHIIKPFNKFVRKLYSLKEFDKVLQQTETL